jgi:pSer/pThr/pTyr-binding forkhead associated (FHA) protein
MTVKGWVLGKMNRMNGMPSDARLAEREPREPTVRGIDDGRDGLVHAVEHLGPYGALIGAIREELEAFAAGQLRLHLAIAERDRYLLTSIDVECEASSEHRDLLRRFTTEFRPEQIKHYLAKEVIAGLRNASAIDLSQFAGLNAMRDEETGDDGYAAIVEELCSVPASAVPRPYKVTLVGRWSEVDARSPRAAPPTRDTPQTPLAARALDIDVDDANGAHRVSLAAVVANRRYVVGKGEGCDITVDGVYASRRHCEVWLERGTWWVADCGSTNGIRVESTRAVVGRADPNSPGRATPIEVPAGACIVLSAHARGDARQYPRLSLRTGETSDAVTPDAGLAARTPVTPIVPARRSAHAMVISAQMASGVKTFELGDGTLPFGVGRSRNQALVVDWTHEDVSGHHFDVVALDANGASVVVHGDNGVRVDGRSHGAGEKFCWKPGETLVLGRDAANAPSCTLTLARAP